MKTAVKIAMLLCLCFFTGNMQSQEIVNTKKATVYIVRISPLGGLINYKFFIEDAYIGKFNHGKYMKFTLDAGTYLIWTRSENSAFIEAEFEADKTYIIEAVPKMGAFKSGVHLQAFDFKNPKKVKKLKKVLAKHTQITFTSDELAQGNTDLQSQIAHGLEKYEKLKEKGKEISTINEAITINLEIEESPKNIQ